MPQPQQQHRREGALQMALPDYDEGPPPLNETLREVAQLTTEHASRAQSPRSSRSNRAHRMPWSIADAVLSRWGAERQRAVRPDPPPDYWTLPSPGALPAQYVRLRHVPRDPSQNAADLATAMMRTWVLVDDEDLVPPPALPVLKAGAAPRPPLARGVCCICMDESRPCEVVFTGCGHMNTCLGCVQHLVEQNVPPGQATPCPLCRIKSRPLLVRVG